VILVPLAETPGLRPAFGDPSVIATGLAVDSRLVQPGSLFVPIRGRVHDGHDFVGDACRAGALAVACAPGCAVPVEGASVFEAKPLAALAAVGSRVRGRSGAAVIAVAGSAGKTSTKDILAALCAPHRRTVASVESFNNEIGVPLTLAGLEADTEVLICELGTGGAGEVAALAAMVRPHVGVITAIGPEHLEFLGSLQGVAAAEAELIGALPAGGVSVLPFAEPLLEPYRRPELRTVTFGLDPRADVHPLRFEAGRSATCVELRVLGRRVCFHTNLRAAYHRLNLCAAVAAYAAIGLPLAGLAEGAGQVALSRWRGQERARQAGGVVINDAYNANPLSMQTACAALAGRRSGSRTVAVLGEMEELGRAAPRWHAQVGAAAARVGIDVVVGIGSLARLYLEGVRNVCECHWFADLGDAKAGLPALLRGSDIVLLKGSRTAGLEQLEDVIA
jgi:UDP-N-acetylmuramoyl-tripeptide--D-alanyl-D-alanine ligase